MPKIGVKHLDGADPHKKPPPPRGLEWVSSTPSCNYENNLTLRKRHNAAPPLKTIAKTPPSMVYSTSMDTPPHDHTPAFPDTRPHEDYPSELEFIGRQAVYSPPLAELVLTHVRQGFSLRAAAGASRLPYRVVAQWVDAHETFGFRVEQALARRVFVLETEILTTADPVRAKILMQALRRSAPEVWAEPKESPPDATTLPQTITLTVIEATPRQLPAFYEPNAPSSGSIN